MPTGRGRTCCSSSASGSPCAVGIVGPYTLRYYRHMHALVASHHRRVERSLVISEWMRPAFAVVRLLEELRDLHDPTRPGALEEPLAARDYGGRLDDSAPVGAGHG